MRKKLFTAGLALVCSCFPLAASAQTYSGIYVFGDSLVDPGNLFRATGGLYPPSPPYFQGRFSNGPVFVEPLAPKLGLTSNPNTNFAFGGATSGTVNAANFFPFLQGLPPQPGTLAQINRFTTTTPSADPNGLYVVYAGGNDYVFGSVLAPVLGPVSPARTVNNLLTGVRNLTAVGAQNILVPNLPDLGKTEFARRNGATQILTTLVNAHNATLTSALSGFAQNNPQVNVIPLDVNAVFNEILADPARYGFTNVTDSCFNVNIGKPPCANPDQFLFSDELHPSAATHRLLADYTFAVLTAPSAIAPQADIALKVAQRQTRDVQGRLLVLRTAPPKPERQVGVFVSGDLNYGSQDSTANQSGYDFNTRGITAGVDYQVTENVALGAAISYGRNNTDLQNNLGEVRIDDYSGSLYTNVSLDNLYVDGILSFGNSNLDISRKIPFDNRTATASTNAEHLSARVSGGYNFTSGAFSAGPTAAVRYDRVNVDGYTEQNAGSLNLVVRDQAAESLVLSVGAQAAYTFNTSFGSVTPFVRASFEHDAGNGSHQLVTELVTQPGIPMRTNLEDRDRDFVRLGVGTQAQFSPQFGAQIDYETVVGRDRGSDNSINAKLRYEF